MHFGSGHRSITRLIFLILVGAATLPASANAAVIEWQVENPFRFFRYSSDFEIHRWAYNGLTDDERSNNAVSAMERRLNNPKWWDQVDESGRTRRDRLADLRRREGREIERHEPKLGWASLLRLDANDTCWNASTQLHRDCRSRTIDAGTGSSYLDPTAHRVVAWIKGGSPSSSCKWTAPVPAFLRNDARSAKPVSALPPTPCSERVLVIAPAKQSLTVSVQDDTGLSDVSIAVQDLTVVGIGDSFSSGEGNPDVPVRLDQGRSVGPAFDQNGLADKGKYRLEFGIPRREDENQPALWLDRRCHRSLYSWQVRSAIALSLRHPQHRSIAYLTFSCSGAEVLEGLLYPYDGREKINPSSLESGGSRRLKRAQLDAVVDELCLSKISAATPLKPGFEFHADDEWIKKNGKPRNAVSLVSCPKSNMRPIDVLLLSVGGNDVGFSRIIANAVVTNGTSVGCDFFTCYSVETIRKLVQPVDIKDAEKRLLWLDGRFKFLHAAIDSRLKLRDDDKGRIVFMAYPSPMSADADGGLCGAGRATMTVSQMFEVKTDSVLRNTDAFVEDKLVTRLNELSRPWTWVDAHRTRFRGHGFCASRETPSESGAGTAEPSGMPYTRQGPGRGFDRWQFFNPTTIFPYESRQRWFRTFNDDYLIINYARTSPYIRTDQATYSNPVDLAQSTLGGPMHPTAEAHSNIANAVLPAVCSVARVSCD